MYTQRSLRACMGGALVAGVTLVALSLQDATPAPLSMFLETTRTRTVAEAQPVTHAAAAHPAATVATPTPSPALPVTTAPATVAAATTAPAAKPAVTMAPQLAGPQPPPAPAMPTGPVIRVGPGDSLSAAAAKAKPGDTVLISGGTYSGGLDIPNDGAPGKPITFQAVPGQRVVITGGGDGNGLVSFSGRSDISMVGITVQGSNSHGIFSEGAKNIVLRDCEVADSQDGGIVFLQSSNVKVQRCSIHGNNARGTSASNEAMSFDHTDGFEISYSKVSNNGEEGIDAKYESSNGKIFNNTVNANRGPNIYVDSARGVDVFNNVVTGTTEESKAGISVAVESLSETRRASDIKIFNNVVKDNAGGGVGFWVESSGTMSNISILNNTIVGNRKGGLNVDSANFGGKNVLRNNIFSGNASDVAGGASGFTADHNLFSGGGIGANLITGVAKFVDGASNLRLSGGSAGVGAGSPDGAPDFDLAGIKRAGRIDLGAYQIPVLAPVPVAVPAAPKVAPPVVAAFVGQVGTVAGQIASNVAASVVGSGARPVAAGRPR